MTTVNIWKNGTVMVQGNLQEFQMAFLKLKEIAETERPHDCESSREERERESDCVPSASRGVEDAEEPPTSEQDQPHPEQNSLMVIKEQFTKLEIELVQLKETVLRMQPAKEPKQKWDYKQELSALTEQVRELKRDRESYREELDFYKEQVRELQRDRDCYREELDVLREQVRELQHEEDQHRRELAALTEERKDREQAFCISHLNPQTPKNQPPSTAPTSSQRITSNQPTSPSAPTRRGKNLHTPAPTTTQAATPRQSPIEPTSNEQEADGRQDTRGPQRADIVLLMDSNGKFLNVKKLFPNHNATKIWCPTTQKALEILDGSQLGSPSHILIHTGTNDIRDQQHRVADSLRAVIEKASNTFPQAKIIMSTLLPRTDVHPNIIRSINASVSRDCALRPNVHLAHNPTMNTGCLYDHVHLHKHVVPVFAKTLKDAAFVRNPPHQPYRRGHQNTPPPVRRSTHYHPQPDMPRRSQERSEPTTMLPTATRPTPAQPPQQLQPQPGMSTYAQALSRTGSPASTDLRDIQQMLSLICARLMSSGSW